MHSAITFERGLVFSSPDYMRAPDGLIMDLDEELTQFWSHLASLSEYESECLDDILSETMMYIYHQESALDGIVALRNHIREMYRGQDNTDDGKILSQAAYILGLAIFHKFQLMGLYTRDGFNLYYPGEWITPTTLRFNKYQKPPFRPRS